MEDYFLAEKLSYRLMGCFYDVRNKYGSGHQERVYDRALDEHLSARNISFIDKPKIPVYSIDTGRKIAIYIPDKLIDEKILVEIKAKPFITKKDQDQVRDYLQTTTYEIIYLVNFGEENFKPIRFVLSNKNKKFTQVLSA